MSQAGDAHHALAVAESTLAALDMSLDGEAEAAALCDLTHPSGKA